MSGSIMRKIRLAMLLIDPSGNKNGDLSANDLDDALAIVVRRRDEAVAPPGTTERSSVAHDRNEVVLSVDTFISSCSATEIPKRRSRKTRRCFAPP